VTDELLVIVAAADNGEDGGPTVGTGTNMLDGVAVGAGPQRNLVLSTQADVNGGGKKPPFELLIALTGGINLAEEVDVGRKLSPVCDQVGLQVAVHCH
jgi:hypothetical protein